MILQGFDGADGIPGVDGRNGTDGGAGFPGEDVRIERAENEFTSFSDCRVRKGLLVEMGLMEILVMKERWVKRYKLQLVCSSCL